LAAGVEKWNRAKVRSDAVSQARALSFAPPVGIWCVQIAPLDDAAVVARVDDLKRKFLQLRGRGTYLDRSRRTQIRRREVSQGAVPWTATSSAISMAYVALCLGSQIGGHLVVSRLTRCIGGPHFNGMVCGASGNLPPKLNRRRPTFPQTPFLVHNRQATANAGT
jgi:hypothetical protein